MCLLYIRSKEDILSEIRRLQSEMSSLEDRVTASAKIMGTAGTQPESTAAAPEAIPEGSKDK